MLLHSSTTKVYKGKKANIIKWEVLNMSKIERITKFKELILSYLVNEINNMKDGKSIQWFAFNIWLMSN